MTGVAAPAPAPEALETPYWRIDAGRERGYTGRALLRRFTMAAAPVARIVRTAAPGSATVVVCAQIVAAVAMGISLILAGNILQSLFAEGAGIARARAAMPALILLGALLLLRIAADAASEVARAHLGPKARREAEQALLRATLHIELASYDDPSFYDQLQRARDRGILHLEGAIASLVATGGAFLSVAAAAVALFVLHPLLPLLLFVAMAPEAWGALAAARIQYGGIATTVALTRQSEMMSELATSRPAASEVRANQAQSYILAEHLTAATALQHHLVRLGIAEAKAVATGRLLSAVGFAATFVALFAMMQTGWVDLAAAGAAVIAIRTAGASLSGLVLAGHELLEKALYISDYRDFLDQAAERTPAAGGRHAPAQPGAIVVDDISFAYPGNPGSPAIRGLSLRIEAGETVALVGENGSGKTTLAKLIAGLFRPDRGTIRWGSADLRDLDPESLAEQVAMVLQEPIKWPRSARDNVRIGRFGRDDPGDTHLLEAARRSRAAEVIDRLPGGWETLLSRQFRGGFDLSAGQWQRLAVARGLYRDAPLVIWDEPTAPLDAKAEHAVYESLRRLARDRTVILITHRLASVRNANRIFFLDAGRVAEQGTHDELIASGGRYFELYQLQRKLNG